MYPPFSFFTVEPITDTTVGGHTVPAHTPIIASPWLVHHNPRYWPHPEVFDPDRFASEVENLQAIPNFVPFGSGARLCPGRKTAIFHTEAAVAVVLQRFDLSVDPAWIEHKALQTSCCLPGLRLVLTERPPCP
jgi:cytochrome P450